MGNVYKACPVDVRTMLRLESTLKDPKTPVEIKQKLEPKYKEMVMKFDGYNTELSVQIDYIKSMKKKGIDVSEIKQEVTTEVAPVVEQTKVVTKKSRSKSKN